MGRIFSAGVGQDFLQSVILKLDDLPSMSEAIVYVPTRRLGKALQTEILRHYDGRAVLMPEIRTLGDGEEISERHSILQGTKIPLCVDGLHRKFWLSDAIMRFHKAQGENISLAIALSSADDLGSLFDKVALFETNFDGFQALCQDGDFATHWQHTLTFLNAIYPVWCEHLESLGVLDVGVYKHTCLSSLNTYLESSKKTIFVVGATANYPVIERIMHTVAQHDKGMVFIAGYDCTLTAHQQDNIALDPTHPLYTLQSYINGVGSDNVETINITDTKRSEVFKSVFLSAKDTADWLINPPPQSGFDGLHFMASDTINEESLSIALIMREALEVEGKTCALMTPDRQLSRKVISILKRWNITVDDSSGQPLITTPPALFMRLVLQVVEENFSVQSIASLLKHPFCTLGMDMGVFNRTAQGLEMFGLRGYYGGGGVADIIKHINREKDNKFSYHNPYKNRAQDAIALLKKLQKCFTPLLIDNLTFVEMVKAHIEVCEMLSSVEVLWNKDDGNALAEFMSYILENAQAVSAVNVSDYKASFASLLQSITVRKNIGLHPRLFIWGPLEARLQNVDTMIIAGMNEGIFPAQTSVDAWLSRAMAGDVGLPIADMSIGISANDFISACNGKKIIFSRHEKEDGKQTIPSRWWQRFEAVSKASKFDGLPMLDYDYIGLSKALDKPSPVETHTARISVPAPCPPVSSRPNALSLTNIQTWLEDPYQIYCKYILGLYSSGDLWGEISPALKGNILHATFEEFINKFPREVKLSQLQDLISIGEKHFADVIDIPEVKIFWWTGFKVAAKKFIIECESRNHLIDNVLTEKKAKFTHKTVKGNAFQISGTADRIEVLKDGYCVIADYKTGTAISKKKIESGDAPQLALEAYMLGQGAFADTDSRKVECVEIWEAKPNFKVQKYGADKKPIDNIIEDTLLKIDALIDAYALESKTYFIEKRTAKYNDYLHFMREKEWGLYEKDEEA